jgi:hypothetical protein
LNKDTHEDPQANSLCDSLYDIHNTQAAVLKKIVKHCLDCQNTLELVDDKDTEVGDCFGELHFTAKRVEKRALPQNSLQFIAQENVAASVTNVFFICSRAWLTLAVSVVCGSCVFTQ